MIRELVRIPSVSTVDPTFDMPNAPVVHRLAEWAEELGFECEIADVDAQRGKCNLIASLGKGPGGLVLSGHTDTVAFDESLWSSDPLGGIERDGKLYGRGTTDMKGFFGVVLQAIQQLDTSSLKEPIILLATADEESTMSGAQALVDEDRPKARAAIIGEPTGLVPVRAHKGIGVETIRVIGESGHSSDPALGNSALEGMHLVIATMLAFRKEVGLKHRDPRFQVPEPTMNLGRIHGGDSANRICARCELTYDFRSIPGLPLSEVRRELHQRIDKALAEHSLQVEYVPATGSIPAFETPADAEVVRVAEKLTCAAARAVMFGTEGPFFQQLGLETLILGPGNIDVAHQPNEFLPLEHINPAIRLVQSLIGHYCIPDERTVRRTANTAQRRGGSDSGGLE